MTGALQQLAIRIETGIAQGNSLTVLVRVWK